MDPLLLLLLSLGLRLSSLRGLLLLLHDLLLLLIIKPGPIRRLVQIRIRIPPRPRLLILLLLLLLRRRSGLHHLRDIREDEPARGVRGMAR